MSDQQDGVRRRFSAQQKVEILRERLVDHASCNSTNNAVNHLGSIGSPSFTPNVSPVFATARHWGPPPTECKPTPSPSPPRHVAPP